METTRWEVTNCSRRVPPRPETRGHDELQEAENIFSKDSSHMLASLEITKEMIWKTIKKLDVNKAPGHDEIVPRLIMENGKVPDDWRKANVTPI